MTRVTADSIAAIVAGRGLVPKEVTRVDHVYLNGINPLKASNGGVIFNFPNSTFSLNFDTMMLAGLDPELPGTDTDPTDTLPNDLEDILNAQPEIIAAGGVKVTGVSSTGYAITFNNNGDQLPFTGEETFPLDSLELVPGSLVLPVTEDVVGDNSPPTREVESFAIEPTEGVVGVDPPQAQVVMAASSAASPRQSALTRVASARGPRVPDRCDHPRTKSYTNATEPAKSDAAVDGAAGN